MEKINFCYVILNILLGIVLFLYLRKRTRNQKILLGSMLGYLILSGLSFSYLNGMMGHIFKLQYLSVKNYLIMVVLVNLIMLFTINRNMKITYKVCNYILFIITMVIFGSTLSVLLGNRFPNLYVMNVSNAVNFIDLSFVIFLIYLIIMSLIFIGYEVFTEKKEEEKKLFRKENFQKEKIKKEYFSKNKFKNFIDIGISKKIKCFSIFKKKKSSYEENSHNLLTAEELKNFDRTKPLYIHGVLCNIIFEDSNWENVVRNYQILNEDIQARMVNGYTLEENLMLKNICMKLQVHNLSLVDIHNVSLLNKISIDEYQLLTKVMGMN